MPTLTVFAAGYNLFDYQLMMNGATLVVAQSNRLEYRFNTPWSDTLIVEGSNFFISGTALTQGTVTSISYRGVEQGGVLNSWTGLNLSGVAFQAIIDQLKVNVNNNTALFNAVTSGGANYIGGLNADDFRGGTGNDTFDGGWGDDFFVGGDGNDSFNGGQPVDPGDEENFGTDFDRVSYIQETGANGVNINLQAGNGTDTFGKTDTFQSIEAIDGTNFADSLIGRAGAPDQFTGHNGADVMNGGAGGGRSDGFFDEVRYDREGGTLGVVVNLATGTATDTFGATDTISGFESVRGTSRVDNITGGSSDDRFRGLSGADVFAGGAGSDTVDYSRDVIYSGGGSSVRVNLEQGFARDGFGWWDTLYVDRKRLRHRVRRSNRGQQRREPSARLRGQRRSERTRRQ